MTVSVRVSILCTVSVALQAGSIAHTFVEVTWPALLSIKSLVRLDANCGIMASHSDAGCLLLICLL